MRDLIIGTLLFVAAAAWGTAEFKASVRSGHRPFFYQSYYEPAVMFACGKGFFVTPPGQQPPALRAFLLEQADAFSCEQLPADLTVGSVGLYQRPWRYLMTTVALAWKVLGISWSRLAPMFGVLIAATIVLSYALCRLLVGRLASLLCAIAVAVSPLQLANLPNLRDYAKAPFTIALLAILIAIVLRRWRTREILLLSLVYGVVLGVGYGFRTDLLIDIPPFVITLLLFAPGGVRQHLGWKAASIALCLAAFVVAGWPIITSDVEYGGCQAHVFLLGLTAPFNDTLGVHGGSYGWGHLYNDEYVWANVSTYASRFRPDLGFLEYCSHDYDVASGAYLRAIAFRFPADLMTRGYAAAMHVLNIPFDRARLHVPIGTLVAAAFVIVVSAVELRLALFAVFAILYFTGYPAVQFMPRHYFPFEIVGWLLIAFLVERAVGRALGCGMVGFPTRRALTFGAAAVVVLAAPLWLLRAYQNGHVVALLQSYADAPTEPARLAQAAPGRFRVQPPPSLPNTTAEAIATVGRERARFLEVEIDPSRCAPGTTLTFVYDPRNREIDFTHAVTLTSPAGSGPTRLFEPVYTAFLGVDLSDSSAGCRPQFAFAGDLDREPLLLPAQLVAGWERQPQYQRIQLTR